jgi:pentatricopeptide repeat domain-containing protein 3
LQELLKTVNLNAAVEYIPKIWSDMIIFGHNSRENLLSLMLDTLINNQPAEDDEEQNKKFADIAWDIWEKMELDASNRRQTVTYVFFFCI